MTNLARVRPAVSKAAVLLAAALVVPGGPARAASCVRDRGSEAEMLVQRCTEVSPATRPPCNAQNECSLIESEIQRGCMMLDPKDRPDYCADY